MITNAVCQPLTYYAIVEDVTLLETHAEDRVSYRSWEE